MSNGDEDKVSIQFQNMEKSTQRKPNSQVKFSTA